MFLSHSESIVQRMDCTVSEFHSNLLLLSSLLLNSFRMHWFCAPSGERRMTYDLSVLGMQTIETNSPVFGLSIASKKLLFCMFSGHA